MRPFNTPSAGIDSEWATLPLTMAEMLKPFRSDRLGFGSVSIPVTKSDSCIIDILLIVQASDGDIGRALKFIVAEVTAHVECLLATA
jgi:hypothetical protein